jgi:ABC-type phosphate/phosphonate transport system substrate-binding protein
MIANARMYSVDPETGELWRRLLRALIAAAGLEIQLLDHAEPATLDALWQRPDLAGVFMCGLPFSRAQPQPWLIAAPVPSPAEFGGLPQYWSEWVVRKDSAFHTLEDTFGGRLALTVPGSQSGCVAPLTCLMTAAHEFPPYQAVIAPQVTPLRALSSVIEGAADVAPIDAYAFRLLERYRPDLSSLVRRIGRTASTPIPPLVASQPLPALQAAFLNAHQIPATASLMAKLLLQRFVRPDLESYDALRLNFEVTARYWQAHALASTVHPAFR